MHALKTLLIRYPHLNTKRCLHTDSAEAIAASGDADLVAFGHHFSSNPDLPYRLKHKLLLAPYVRAAFWGGDEKHYSDFPAYLPTVEVAETV
jgi:N-ethylmaleimide reductase